MKPPDSERAEPNRYWIALPFLYLNRRNMRKPPTMAIMRKMAAFAKPAEAASFPPPSSENTVAVRVKLDRKVMRTRNVAMNIATIMGCMKR